MESAISKLENVKAPAAFIEVWAIVLVNGTLLPPIDCESACFMAFPTEADALRAMISQRDKSYIFDEEGDLTTVRRIA